jgi:D-sedoheptulose 7-phosphate isomerase
MQTEAQYLEAVMKAAQRVDLGEVRKCIDWLADAYRDDRQVFLIGNGGSAANASHMAEDLAKSSLHDSDQKRFRVLSLADNTAYITAIANDIGYEDVFAFQLRQFMQAGDILIAISGSGNSRNIVKAAEYTKQNGGKVIGMTGFDGGKLLPMSDVRLHVPLKNMCQSEAVHGILLHMVVDLLRERLHPDAARR